MENATYTTPLTQYSTLAKPPCQFGLPIHHYRQGGHMNWGLKINPNPTLFPECRDLLLTLPHTFVARIQLQESQPQSRVVLP